ncbi:TetR/AcrR family transcriptional regulator [Nocardia wallacei]|uniref:TetR/AcrR family transcriptional regulator n=1 Tax=Nocardia wallacei TaxID=480035 RepID=UPI0024578321|nr:TetR/AcrR family transcriptional regulator [Nocardia wallacei]
MTSGGEPRRRADAERSRAAIIDAAARLFAQRPGAGLAAVAAQAGVTRQTIYAHFASRDDLLAAVVDHVTDRTMAAMNALDPDEGSATDALMRMLEVSWRAFEEYPVLSRGEPVPGDDRARHVPVDDHLQRLIRRGQRTGEFDRTLKPDWLATSIIALGHAAGEQVKDGRMTTRAAEKALRDSVLRLVGSSSS